jgi:uncharacterized membrane-anchored protein YitT (DUF2179 family)
MGNKVLHRLKELFVLILSSFLFAFAMYYFIFANEFTNGGVAGIVAMINYLIRTDDYSGYINFAINLPLILLAFVGLSKEFAVKTTISIFFVSFFLTLFATVGEAGFSQYTAISVINGQKYYDVGKCILASLFGGGIAGVALALVFSVKGSTGGTDIAAAFIQRKNPAVSVQWGIFVVNSVIVTVSAFVYAYKVDLKKFVFDSDFLQPVMLAIIFQFVSATVCDIVLQGGKTALKFEVVTDNPDELSKELLATLKHGVTLVPAKGMYEYKEKGLLICVVSKRQIQDFKNILKKYPNTFAYVAPVSEIIGVFNLRK